MVKGNKAKAWFLRRRAIKWATSSNKRMINVCITIVFVIFFVLASWIPANSYGSFVFSNKAMTESDWVQVIDAYPTVKYHGQVTMTTAGSFSELNSIHIEVHITNANVTDLTRHYTHVKFMDLEKFSTNEGFELKPSSDGGGWVATGDISFYNTARVWMFLSPNSLPVDYFSTHLQQAALITSQKEIVRLGPASDTLTLQFNSFAVKTAFVFGTFSILLFAPIIEGIVISDDKQDQLTEKQGSAKQGQKIDKPSKESKDKTDKKNGNGDSR